MIFIFLNLIILLYLQTYIKATLKIQFLLLEKFHNGENMFKKLFALILLIFLMSSCAGTYNPAIVKKHNYSSFDISFIWKFEKNTLYLTGINNFWTELFNVSIKITPLNSDFTPLSKPMERYIGSIEMDGKFKYSFNFNEKNIKYFQIDYFYNYSGYNSSGTLLNYYTIYLNLKK